MKVPKVAAPAIFMFCISSTFCKGQNYSPIPLDSISWRIFVDDEVQFTCHEQYVFDYIFSKGIYIVRLSNPACTKVFRVVKM